MDKDITYLEVILRAVEKIEAFIDGVSEEMFLRNEMMKSACLMELIVIGEYGGKVSQELKDRFSDIEWQQMKAARNFFVHAYDYVDWMKVWFSINEVVPSLKTKIEKIIAEIA